MVKVVNGDLKVLNQTNPADDEAVPVGLLLQHWTSGTKFVRVSASQVKLSPAGLDGKARIAMSDGSTVKGFVTSSDITADVTASGANGLDTGSEAATTFYHLFAIGKSDGTLALLLSTSATSPTMPSGYTFKRLLWGVANDASSNFYDFVHLRNGTCLYLTTQLNNVRGANLLNAGTSLSPAAIDMSKVVPDVAWVIIGGQAIGSNSNATGSVLVLSEDSGQTMRLFVSRTLGTGVGASDTEHWTVELRNTGSLATSLYYDWSVAASALAYFWVQWWNIGTRWG